VIEFQVHRAIDGQFYCRIVASNGEVLFISETYHNKQDLVHAANVVRAYATSADPRLRCVTGRNAICAGCPPLHGERSIRLLSSWASNSKLDAKRSASA